VTEPPSSAGRQAAASYLRELLYRPGRYRRLWEQHAVRIRAGEINRLAVAETIATHLWEHPRAAGTGDVLAALGRLENLDLRVEFHPGRLPASVCWAVWDGLEGDITRQEPVSLDRQQSVHLRLLEKAVVGYQWSWPEAES
jgi:hypothetical protein